MKAIKNELASFYAYTAAGSLKAFGYLFSGSLELLQPGMDLGHAASTFKDFIKAVKESVLDGIDAETADHLLETLETIINEFIKKQSEGVDVRMCLEHLPDILNFLLRCLTAYNVYKL
jgi:hypothetical protein